jgi:hypothetical protein
MRVWWIIKIISNGHYPKTLISVCSFKIVSSLTRLLVATMCTGPAAEAATEAAQKKHF